MVDELEADEVGLDELVVDEVKNRPSGCRRGARLPWLRRELIRAGDGMTRCMRDVYKIERVIRHDRGDVIMTVGERQEIKNNRLNLISEERVNISKHNSENLMKIS